MNKKDSEEENMGSNWIVAVKAETEHYYQGEIQQENRLSWLLALQGVFLAVIISFLFDIRDGKAILVVSLFQGITIIVPLVLSMCVTLLGLYPLRGKKDKRIFQRIRKASLDTEELIKIKFFARQNIEEADYQAYIYNHFISHFKRSMVKRCFVVLSLSSFIISVVFMGINILIMMCG